MRLLLSNDDGVNAPGLRILADRLAAIAEIKVVAPDRDHSGASHSLTLSRPLALHETPNGFFALDGTPTDCVHIGLSRTLGNDPERVVSGINTHANLGDDVLYSGTVAAAVGGRSLPKPALAVSLANDGRWHFDTAAEIVAKILLHPNPPELPPRTILNINVPDVPLARIRGWQVTRLGHRFQSDEPVAVHDPRGRLRYWIAAAGRGDDAGPGTDFHAVEAGFVSVSPIHVDMTRHDAVKPLAGWLEKI